MAFADPKGTALRVGLLISSSENPQNANFAITEFSEVRFQRAKSYMDAPSLSGPRETVSPSGVARRWDSLYGAFVARCACPCVRCEKGKPVVRRGRKAQGPPSWEVAGLPNSGGATKLRSQRGVDADATSHQDGKVRLPVRDDSVSVARFHWNFTRFAYRSCQGRRKPTAGLHRLAARSKRLVEPHRYGVRSRRQA